MLIVAMACPADGRPRGLRGSTRQRKGRDAQS